MQRPEVVELFERQGVFSRVELASRFEVYSEQYVLAIEVEARLALHIARTQIYPVAMRYLSDLVQSQKVQAEAGLNPSAEIQNNCAALIAKMQESATALESAAENPPHGTNEHMRHCADTVLPLLEQLREAVDGLEGVVDDNLWPLPTYQEMLFMR